MRSRLKFGAVLGLVIGVLLPSNTFAQSTGISTRAQKELDKAFTAAGYFGLPRYATGTLPTCTTRNRGAAAFDTTSLSLKVCNGTSWAAAVTSNPALNTAQTPDTYYFSTDPLGNSLIIGEAADSAFDFAYPLATDPTLVIRSRNQSTTEWIGLTHNGTSGVISSGVGGISMPQQLLMFSSWNVNAFGDLLGLNNGKLGFIAAAGAGFNAVGDAFFMRSAAAAIQMGPNVNGAPVNQTFKAHDGVIGTDIKGASLTLAGGLGTGKAASNPLTLNRVIGTTTGTAAQTYAPGYVVCPAVRLSTTSATAQTIATITTTSTTGGGVTMDYTSVACSASTCDADGGIVKVAWNNNAGTVAAAMTAVVAQSDSDATGTLATTPTATVATNVVSIKFTPTWATIVPTSVLGYATFTVASSADTVVCTQQ